jgi:uncharacterized protein (DUF1800 family)
MAIGPDIKAAFIAFQRFGFGARGKASAHDLSRAAADPRGLLAAELAQPQLARLDATDLPETKVAFAAVFSLREQRRMAREAAATKNAAVAASSPEASMPSSPQPPEAKRTDTPRPQELFRADALAHLKRAINADLGFVERLVHFWSNHFCVSAAKGGLVRASAGSFEREAIRPYVLGRFADMLRAVESHPTMLFYLDNAQSFGPRSSVGERRRRGLNENLAREILELHTLGVDGGYTQDDVTSLARIITGWTFAGREGRIGEPGTFVYLPSGHEPGDHRLLGKVYRAGGIEQGEAALTDLARQPATARHIATKFARHFVADEPPAGLVTRLAQSFRESDGNLSALAGTLISSEEAWSAPLSKIRSPREFLIAAFRAIDRVPEEPGPLLGSLATLGMPLWQPPGPNGWPDTTASWASPEGVKLRLDVSASIAARAKDLIDPAELLATVVGETASRETRQTIQRAESRQQGLALLLMSPEFQWR